MLVTHLDGALEVLVFILLKLTNSIGHLNRLEELGSLLATQLHTHALLDGGAMVLTWGRGLLLPLAVVDGPSL